MWCNQIFSVMSYSETTQVYTIENIIVADNYQISNQIARGAYGSTAIALDTTLVPVSIGDTYKDGVYYSTETGNIIEPNPTEAEQIAALNTTVNDLATTQADILYEMSLAELDLTEEEITVEE